MYNTDSEQKTIRAPLADEQDQQPELEIESKTFLYLLLAENCLPEDLRPSEAIGNGTDIDVLVLSYRRVCNLQPPSLAHVKYIYNNSITWTQGRNLLYEASQKRKEKYWYYIFLDDDVVLDIKNNPGKVNPWRKFEEFLLRVEPAVGIADSSQNPRAPIAEKSRKNLKCELPNKVEYIPSPRFDACFNAFHRKAINYLLPYLPKFDKISWWFSGRFIEAKCEVVFPGQVVIHTYIRAINKLHRKYPKRFATKQDEELIYNEIEKTIPPKYHNCSIIREMRRNGRDHASNSSTFCLPPPKPKETIQPFRLTVL